MLAGFAEILKQPDWIIYEYTGCIFEARSGVYRISHVVRLSNPKAARSYCKPPPAPAGMRLVANFHNHPTLDEISPVDVEAIPAVPHYVRGPTGRLHRYTPATAIKDVWDNGR